MKVSTQKSESQIDIYSRQISLGVGLAAIPERLLLAHAQGKVLFITGAGISKPAGLPDFRELVIAAYKQLDPPVYEVISKIPQVACNLWEVDKASLGPAQAAEVKRFISGDYDVVLGMLERRMDGRTDSNSTVRRVLVDLLRKPGIKPAPIHHTLIRLADRGDAKAIVTTNFDLLLEEATKRSGTAVNTYTLGGIPRPALNDDFAGVFHIHGALDRNPKRLSDIIVSDQDFGEFYLRRRIVPDFIYDAARLFHLVLIGYSANDAPMRYLLNAVAADDNRFEDVKERFIFTSSKDPIDLKDWRGRGITPIPYSEANGHEALLNTLKRWAVLSVINGNKRAVDTEIKRIVKIKRSLASDADRDLFDHFIRRNGNDHNEQVRISGLVSKHKADIDWLDAIVSIAMEHNREGER